VGDCGKNVCSSEKNENCHEEENEECCKEEFFLEVADCAWTEVLKDEIKKHILATEGERMKELAKIVAEANGKRWQNKMESKKHCSGFKEKLCQFFSKHK